MKLATEAGSGTSCSTWPSTGRSDIAETVGEGCTAGDVGDKCVGMPTTGVTGAGCSLSGVTERAASR